MKYRTQTKERVKNNPEVTYKSGYVKTSIGELGGFGYIFNHIIEVNDWMRVREIEYIQCGFFENISSRDVFKCTVEEEIT